MTSLSKVEELRTKREEVISKLETPLVIGISTEKSVNWKKWVDTYANILKHRPSSVQITINQTDFIAHLQDLSREFIQFQDNAQNKFLKHSLDFYRARSGKDKTQKEEEINKIMSDITISALEKAYRINPQLASIDKFFDEKTQKNIDNLLHKEFDKHSSRGSIIKKVESILQGRAASYQNYYLKSAINMSQAPSQLADKQLLSEHRQATVHAPELPILAEKRSSKEPVKAKCPAPPPPIRGDQVNVSSATELNARKASGVLPEVNRATPPPPLPLSAQKQSGPNRLDLLVEIQKGKQLKKVDDKDIQKSTVGLPKVQNISEERMLGAIAKQLEERRVKMGYEEDTVGVRSSEYSSRNSSAENIPEALQKEVNKIAKTLEDVEEPKESQAPTATTK
ncbi:MAG: hypothetical protein AB8U25_02125 [Rickettsiales endosymbiont of Dermacentor nuttalli]